MTYTIIGLAVFAFFLGYFAANIRNNSPSIDVVVSLGMILVGLMIMMLGLPWPWRIIPLWSLTSCGVVIFWLGGVAKTSRVCWFKYVPLANPFERKRRPNCLYWGMTGNEEKMELQSCAYHDNRCGLDNDDCRWLSTDCGTCGASQMADREDAPYAQGTVFARELAHHHEQGVPFRDWVNYVRTCPHTR